MFCKKCGEQIPDNAKFCPKCGAPVSVIKSTQKGTSSDSIGEPEEQFVESRSSNKSKLPKFVIPTVIAAAAVVVIVVAAVSVHSNRVKKPASDDMLLSEESGENSAEINEASESAEDDAPKELKDYITISDVTVDTYEYDTITIGADGFSYVIGMTVQNDSDVSVDVSPSLEATVLETDNYGEQHTTSIVLTRSKDSEIFCPYSAYFDYGLFSSRSSSGQDDYKSEYLVPVGMAPHETKTVCYYVDCIYNPAGGDWYDFGEENQILSCEVIDFTAEEPECVYVAVDDWASDIHVEKLFEKGGMTLSDRWYYFVTGTVTNNTDDKWEAVRLQFDIRKEGRYVFVYDHNVTDAIQSFEYVNTGETIDILEEGMESYYKSNFTSNLGGLTTYSEDTELELIPALLWYYPDD